MSKKQNSKKKGVGSKLTKGLITAAVAVSAIPATLVAGIGTAEASSLTPITSKVKGDIITIDKGNGTYAYFEVIQRTTDGVKVRAMEAIELAYDSSGKTDFDPNSKTNIAYQLNGDKFLSSFSQKAKDLFVDTNWNTGNEKQETTKQVKAKVGLLTKSEAESAAVNPGKLSVNIGVPEWLITSGSEDKESLWSISSSGKYETKDSEDFLYARPVVVLKADLTVDVNGLVTDKAQAQTNTVQRLQTLLNSNIYNQNSIAEMDQLLKDVSTANSGLTQTEIQNLRDKVDAHKKYLTASETVRLAEYHQHEGYINAAQTAINLVKDQNQYKELQARLDVLKQRIEANKEAVWKDLLNGVNLKDRMQSVADLLEVPVYAEFADKYSSVIIDLVAGQGNVAKADVAKAIKLVNSFEIAKRSMTQNDIRMYAAELRTASQHITYNFPSEQLLISVANYTIAPNERTKETLMKNLSTSLNVLAVELESQLKDLVNEIQGVTSGTYKVEYIDSETKEKIYSHDYVSKFGKLEITPKAPDGYKLVKEEVVTYDFKSKDSGKVFTFEVVKDQKVTTGSYTVRYLDPTGKEVHKHEFKEQELSEVVVTAEEVEGYSLAEGEKGSVTLLLTAEENHKEVTFLVVPNVEEVEKPAEETEKPLEENQESVQTDVGGTTDGSTSTDQSEPQSGTTAPPETEPQSDATEVPEGEHLVPADEIVESEGEVGTVDENVVSTFSLEPTSLDGVKVASLDTVYFSSTPVEITTLEEEYKRYSEKAAQAALLVGEYLTNKDESFRLKVKEFVNKELSPGEYKLSLLNILKDSGEVLDSQLGNANLQIYNPTPKNVNVNLNPSTNNNNNTNTNNQVNNSNNTQTQIVRPSVTFKHATEAEKKKPTTEEKEKPVINSNGDATWTVTNPTEQALELSEEHISVKLELGTTVGKVGTLEVAWKELEKNHFTLTVKADGKEITDYKANITVKGDYQYVQRKVSGGYKATPYAFGNDKFVIKNVVGATYYFHSEVKSFKDTGSHIKEANYIHEMASRGILKGTGDGKFSPTRKVTRAHFAAIITRALGLSASDKETPFVDTRGEWYEEEIQALYEAGLVHGVTRTNYNPNENITAQQAASMLYRVLSNSSVHEQLMKDNKEYADATVPDFKDADKIAEEAQLPVAKLQALGIMEGTLGGKFNPYATLTRADLVEAIYKTLVITGDL